MTILEVLLLGKAMGSGSGFVRVLPTGSAPATRVRIANSLLGFVPGLFKIDHALTRRARALCACSYLKK